MVERKNNSSALNILSLGAPSAKWNSLAFWYRQVSPAEEKSDWSGSQDKFEIRKLRKRLFSIKEKKHMQDEGGPAENIMNDQPLL